MHQFQSIAAPPPTRKECFDQSQESSKWNELFGNSFHNFWKWGKNKLKDKGLEWGGEKKGRSSTIEITNRVIVQKKCKALTKRLRFVIAFTLSNPQILVYEKFRLNLIHFCFLLLCHFTAYFRFFLAFSTFSFKMFFSALFSFFSIIVECHSQTTRTKFWSKWKQKNEMKINFLVTHRKSKRKHFQYSVWFVFVVTVVGSFDCLTNKSSSHNHIIVKLIQMAHIDSKRNEMKRIKLNRKQ